MDHQEFSRLVAERFGAGYGMKSRAARFLGVSHPFISMCLNGSRPIPDRFQAELTAEGGEGNLLRQEVIRALRSLRETTDLFSPPEQARLMVRDIANEVFAGPEEA